MHWYLEILKTTWVLWGYGPRADGPTFVDRATIPLGDLGPLEFELPEPLTNGVLSEEYERKIGYGWRFTYEGGSGHSWRYADTPEEAFAAAMRSLNNQRLDTQNKTASARRDVRIREEL